ncbi:MULTISPECIES: hypothetical protein [Rhodococcus]|uniref:hypothetical protein n=1 Tax=Rhodococcus TaxID=1827 RepID=UPI00030F56D3|nr:MULTISPECIES: hypothetical protein [Rhodococcus]MBD8052623.1 hypothetical protein [Rhodococcus ruber]MBP2210508.1 hypothetical protein [Rhodococcus ruber]MCF8783743.1 hypothetical protein [Rhodococcus ruber]MDO2376857.1 hypothetical protein [Rhodococcus ruber]
MRRRWKWDREEPLFGDPESPRGMVAIVAVVAAVVVSATVLLLLTSGGTLR